MQATRRALRRSSSSPWAWAKWFKRCETYLRIYEALWRAQARQLRRWCGANPLLCLFAVVLLPSLPYLAYRMGTAIATVDAQQFRVAASAQSFLWAVLVPAATLGLATAAAAPRLGDADG